MDLRVNGRALGGTVSAIPSKSQAHRLLICAALADKESKIYCPALNDDISATADCLVSLGAKIDYENGAFTVCPIKSASSCVLNCRESGSTLRFLLPVVCAMGADCELVGAGRLPERPLGELCAALRLGGAEVSADNLPIRTSKKLIAGVYKLPSKVSSQYISGLMFALPLIGGESKIELDGEPESAPYIEMTIAALELFGVKVLREKNSFIIPAGQRYVSPNEVKVEGDWSNAAFWLCAGAIGSREVSCTGLNVNSFQGDREIINLLRRFGAGVSQSENCVRVSPAPICGIEIDAKNIPDLVPVLAVTAAMASGDTRIYNASRLRMKESDRIKTTLALVSGLGGSAEETADGLVIHGGGLCGGRVSSFGDHRIAMAAAVAAIKADVEIENAEAVNKSYPAFFEDYKSLGGEIFKLSPGKMGK